MIIKAKAQTIRDAAVILRRGGLVAFPTETVYGIGANSFDTEAVARIFQIKGRPSDNPMIVHIASMRDIHKVAYNIPHIAQVFMKKFWPGPLTLILQKKSCIPDIVSAGLTTVGVRMPRHPVALALIRAVKAPIAAPSANISGKPSATSSVEVFNDFGDKVDMILDGGKTKVGIESTVVDCTVLPPVILRQGGITFEELQRIVPNIMLGGRCASLMRSPGTRYRHYAPQAPLTIIYGDAEQMVASVQHFVDVHINCRVGILATKEFAGRYHGASSVLVLGSRALLRKCASRLFTMLRHFDKLNIDCIVTESFPLRGMGRVIMDRLERAAHQ